MDCGSSDFVCRALVWLRAFGVDIAQWDGLLRELGLVASDNLRWVVEFVIAHSEKIFGLAGFSFGVWKWWYYRESVLHKRLQEYLIEQDKRLHQARSYVLEALLRPGPKRRFAEPLFAVKPLRALLRRRGWRVLFGARNIEFGADRLLRKALRKIEAQLKTAQALITSLHDQNASAHILRGAIASARAGETKSDQRATTLDRSALDDFRFSLTVPGKHEIEAKEYEAHQLRRLGHLRDAEDAYKELDALALRTIPVGKERDLVRARARRWLASIAQAHTCDEFKRGAKSTEGSKYANRLMTGQRNATDDGGDSTQINARGALPLREAGRPFQQWDAIEQGDMHYLSAFIYRKLGFTKREGKQLDAADTSYRSVINQTPTSRWFDGGTTRRLRAAAFGGLNRINEAQTNSIYDTKWVLPQLNDPQDQASSIGNSTSN